MENILVLQQVSKKFGQQYALTDVSLTIKKGDIYGLIGKNGAGKTTLIKIIAQLLESDSGSVSLFGSQNQKEWTQGLKRVGSVIETPVAHNHLTAYENLNYYCKLRHIPHADKVIQETLEYVNLTDTGKKKFRDFSPSLSSVWSLEWIYHESSTKTVSAMASLNSAIIFLNSLSALVSHFYTFSLFKLSPLRLPVCPTELEVHLALFCLSWELLSSFNFSAPSLGLVSYLLYSMPVTLSYLAF